MKVFWYDFPNFGDTLTPIILKGVFGIDAEYAQRNDEGKLIAIGSLMNVIEDGDVVWGTGIHSWRKRDKKDGVTFLAVRGSLTRDMLLKYGNDVPEVYGDPALLLPLIYNPKIEKKFTIGYLPHYCDKELIPEIKEGEIYIDVQQDWKTVIDQVLSCDKIISSSLHGILCAEVYNVPVQWAVYSDKILGGEFKYQDYFLGTGRERQIPFTDIPPILNLKEIQDGLISVFNKHYNLCHVKDAPDGEQN